MVRASATIDGGAQARGESRRRGAALFVVLLFSAFLAALAASALRMGLSGARAAAAFADGVRADELGRSAGDILAFHLAGAVAPERRGGAIAVRLPGADVTIDYLSESARVDANLAPVALIAALLGAVGAEPAEAEAVAARITRFRAEAVRRAAEAGAVAPNAPAPATGGAASLQASVDALSPTAKTGGDAKPLAVRDPADVAQAWGLTDRLARQVLPYLSVSNGSGTVDPVLAGRPVLQALLGGDERVEDYLQRRRQGFVSKDSALDLLPVPSRDFAGFKDSPAVRATARVRLANRVERRYEMILLPPPSQTPGQPAADSPPQATPAPPDRAGVPVVVSWRKLQ